MPADGRLHLTFDRKVSPRNVWRGGYDLWNARIPNSFGLPAGASCPGRTPFCVSCYGESCERRPDVARALAGNLALLQAAGTVDSMAELLVEMLGRYRAAAGDSPPLFRIHWDGDFFSRDYAAAWAAAMATQPDVQFWAYTRSFQPPVDVIDLLIEVPNLALYLSVDAWNHEAADRHPLRRHPRLHVALCATTFAEARSLAPDAVPCPENALRIPLVGDDGRGACVSCGICPAGRRDIMLTTTHAEGTAVFFPAHVGVR